MLRPVALLAAALLALTACTAGDEEPGADTTPTAEPTPLTDFATDEVTIARDAFCSRVAPAAVEDALGGAPARADEWVNGDRATVGGVTDVVHEFGCRWRAADGTAVSGWVFAPPVTPGRAAVLRRAAARADGCRPVAGAPAYGSPSVAVRCDDGTTSFHGLFGDAWLSCSAPSGDLAVAGRWCVSVAQAATA
ncbi:hypothetical protein [Nocardioides pyridinolyticus]